MDNQDRRMRDKLIEVYPDENITNVRDVRFYKEFNDIRIAKGVKLKKYIIDVLGLSYDGKKKNFTIYNLEENLLIFYPDKTLQCINDLNIEHQQLHLSLLHYCDIHHIVTVDYLISIDFIIKNIDSETHTRIVNRNNSIMSEDKRFVDKYLDKLENIQNNRSKTKVTSIIEKQKRNRDLVVTLKTLYKHTCQLCSNDKTGFQAPIIKRDDDNPYVEMHHIQGLANEIDESDLDTYRNGIILCAFHHKYVHYYLGGFKELVKDKNDTFYLKSIHGKFLKVYINYHLKTDLIIEVPENFISK